MKRTIEEIKQEMIKMFVQDDDVAYTYGIDQDKSFEEQFSKVSIENIIFYIVACAVWSVKNLFEILKTEIRQMLDLRVPHTLKWYQNKVLRFQYPSDNLVKDKDYYNNENMTGDQIKEREIIKFCAIDDLITELQVKIATGEGSERGPIEDRDIMDCLERYLNEIKDAGVKINIINLDPDLFYIDLAVYYNPLYLFPKDGLVEEAIKNYIANLPFNSTLSTTKLVDVVQAVKGVELVNIKSCKVKHQYEKPTEWEDLDVQKIPVPGYYKIEDEDKDLKIKYIRYTNKDFNTADEDQYEYL